MQKKFGKIMVFLTLILISWSFSILALREKYEIDKKLIAHLNDVAREGNIEDMKHVLIEEDKYSTVFSFLTLDLETILILFFGLIILPYFLIGHYLATKNEKEIKSLLLYIYKKFDPH